MPGTLDRRGHPALVFQRVASDAAWKNLALGVDELQQEIRILVVNVLDTELAEAALLRPLLTQVWVAEKFYIVS